MTTATASAWRRTDREILLTAIFADAGIASSEGLLALLAALYRRRPDDFAHAQRVANIAVRIAEELGLSGQAVTDIERAAWLHDVGKLVIADPPDEDGGEVKRVDFEVWTRQLTAATGIIEGAPALRAAAALVFASRECVDGSGFPQRLAGNAIPIGARILHVADTFDALTELCAAYAVPVDSVNVELMRHAGTRFDAAVVAAWIRLVEEGSLSIHSRSGDGPDSLS